MQLESLSAYLPSLDTTIDPHPTVVKPGTPLLQVIALMSQAPHQRCLLAGSHDDPIMPDPTSAVLVVDGLTLVGIFTEHDLVKLTATQANWRDRRIEEVMSQPVQTLTYAPEQSLLIALSMFREYRIRHLPVLNAQGQILGLISSSSIRKALQPLNLLKWKQIKDVMTHEVISAPACTSVLELTQLMIQHQISSVVLIDPKHTSGRHPVGLITERDIVQYQALELDLTTLLAESVMSSPLFSVKASDPLLKAQQLMQYHRIRRLVVTGEDGALKGLVTQGNLLRVFDPLEMYELLEFLHETVERRTYELNQTNHQLQAEIIEREQIEAQLRATLAKEQELNQFRSYVTAMASHDLRLPLTTISLSAELLQQNRTNIPPEKQDQYLERIRSSVRRMNQLLNDILIISEVEAGQITLRPTHLELVQFCQMVIDELQLATQSRCLVQFNCAIAQYPVQADEKVLRQILVNLLSNAIKYSPIGSTVVFDLRIEVNQVVMRIQDQGIGIPLADQPQLFKPFYRASNVGSLDGTGLGLAIVKSCVDAFQGAIALTSDADCGTTFTVTLPLQGVL